MVLAWSAVYAAAVAGLDVVAGVLSRWLGD